MGIQQPFWDMRNRASFKVCQRRELEEEAHIPDDFGVLLYQS